MSAHAALGFRINFDFLADERTCNAVIAGEFDTADAEKLIDSIGFFLKHRADDRSIELRDCIVDPELRRSYGLEQGWPETAPPPADGLVLALLKFNKLIGDDAIDGEVLPPEPSAESRPRHAAASMEAAIGCVDAI